MIPARNNGVTTKTTMNELDIPPAISPINSPLKKKTNYRGNSEKPKGILHSGVPRQSSMVDASEMRSSKVDVLQLDLDDYS